MNLVIVIVMVMAFSFLSLFVPRKEDRNEKHKEYTIEEMMFYDWLFHDDD